MMVLDDNGSLRMDRRQRMENFASSGGYAFFPGQLEFYSRVACTNSALIAAATGTGKTLGAITLARLSEAERILVVAPRGVLPQWEKEIHRFWKTIAVYSGTSKILKSKASRKGVFLTYPEAIFHGWPRLSDKILSSFGCIVLDESHIYGNLDSDLTKGMLKLRAPFRYAFSATPLRNASGELFPVCGWISSGDWPDKRSPAFDFGTSDLDRFRGSLESGSLAGWMGEKVFSLDKVECNPATVPAQFNIQRVSLSPTHEVHYALLSAGGYGFVGATERSEMMRSFCARPETSPKIQAVISRCVSLARSGERVVVVGSRTAQLTFIHSSLLKQGLLVSRIDGTVPADQHGKEAETFKAGGSQVMIMGIKCAQSYSFECSKHLILASMEYSFSTFWQAVGRVWRVTSPRPVEIDCFVLKDTIEERILDSVLKKQELAQKAVGLDYSLTKNLTTWPSSAIVAAT